MLGFADQLLSGGITVERSSVPANYSTAISDTLDHVNQSRGAVLSSNYEYPGRYTRWDTAIIDPPLGIEASGRNVTITAYNERGKVLLKPIVKCLRDHPHISSLEAGVITSSGPQISDKAASIDVEAVL